MKICFNLFGTLFPLERELTERRVGKESKHDFSLFEDDRFVPKTWFRGLGRVNG